MKTIEVEYAGTDLEAMNFAENYHRWILNLLKPYIGKHLVEVGAGTGSFSEMLLETEPASLSLVEPSEMYLTLTEKLSKSRDSTVIKYFRNVFTAVADEIRDVQTPDTLIYINVLEHIENVGKVFFSKI